MTEKATHHWRDLYHSPHLRAGRSEVQRDEKRQLRHSLVVHIVARGLSSVYCKSIFAMLRQSLSLGAAALSQRQAVPRMRWGYFLPCVYPSIHADMFHGARANVCVRSMRMTSSDARLEEIINVFLQCTSWPCSPSCWHAVMLSYCPVEPPVLTVKCLCRMQCSRLPRVVVCSMAYRGCTRNNRAVCRYTGDRERERARVRESSA